MNAGRHGKGLHSTAVHGKHSNSTHCLLTRRAAGVSMESAFLMQGRGSKEGDRKKEIEMRKKLMWFVCLGVSVLVICLCGGLAWATLATLGFVGTTIAKGRFG